MPYPRFSLYVALMLFVFSLMLVACGGQASSPVEAVATSASVTSQAAPDVAAEPASTAPAQTPPQASADSTPQTLLTQAAPRPRPAEIPGLTLGQDYEIIDNGQRFTQGDNVEVAEVFAYWCGGCAHFDPLVEGWKPHLPAGAAFVYVPMVGNPQDQFPRAFYAAEAVGITNKVHSAVFRAIHIERSLRPNASIDDIAAFLARQSGGTAAEIKSTMESFAVNAQLGRARQFAIRNGVTHTPMLIIDGSYRVNGQSQQDQLRIADRIIAHLTRKTG